MEIGAGVGANVDYLQAGARLVAVEPSLRMHGRLRDRAAEADLELEVVARGAESLPLEDATYDEVICSLVLCTVADPDGALLYVPGGLFELFLPILLIARGFRTVQLPAPAPHPERPPVAATHA